MHHIKIPEGWEIAENEATPEAVWTNRRDFIKGTSLACLATAALVTGCGQNPLHSESGTKMSDLEKTVYPVRRNDRYPMDRRLTKESVAATYNNFYEFTEDKASVHYHVRGLETRPWTVEVTGLVHKAQTFDRDDLIKTFPIEERLYRLRCVEAWSMAVPWTGFPLKALLDRVQPRSKATHVRMTTFYQPLTALGQLAFWEPWPYTEGLTLAEAMNELSFLAVGIYGHPLPKQHGSPVRLVVPWKYGFKSIKSIVSIELIDHAPATFWNTLIPHEYDLIANVNPKVPHPRWSQAREKLIGTEEIRLTLPYNGYGEYVAQLYT